jgi:hypothetical protein
VVPAGDPKGGIAPWHRAFTRLLRKPGAVDLGPACPLGVGGGTWSLGSPKSYDVRPGSIEARELLKSPNFGATPQAADDLKRGVADKRLAAALGMLTEKHRICVDTFKKGHFFLQGVLDGPRIPEGYGKAGGLLNAPLRQGGRHPVGRRQARQRQRQESGRLEGGQAPRLHTPSEET